LRCDGEEIATSEFGDLADIAEARAHDDCFVAKFLVVVVDGGDGVNTGIFGRSVVLACVFLVPVENTSDEGRDEGGLGFGRSDGLMKTEEQRHVAVDALLLENLS